MNRDSAGRSSRITGDVDLGDLSGLRVNQSYPGLQPCLTSTRLEFTHS